MYVITHHHDYDEVLLGPIEWNPRFIASVLRSDLDLNYTPTITPSDESKVPYNILPNVRVRPIQEVLEPINSKTQFHVGPYWSYTDDLATAEYRATDKNIDVVKGELKEIVAAERYKKEIAGTTVIIQGQEVSVVTDRDGRKIYSEKLSVIGEGTLSWKFGNAFIDIAKSDLETIINAVHDAVQSAFDWEATKFTEIDTCETLEQLDAIVIIDPIEITEPTE
jgi:hypothetical protein